MSSPVNALENAYLTREFENHTKKSACISVPGSFFVVCGTVAAREKNDLQQQELTRQPKLPFFSTS